MPYIAPSGELKTKPTQHSVAALRSIGIQPDALVCRSDREIPTGLKRKISLMCDVDAEGVISCADAPSIYDIPKVLHREGLDAYVVRRLGLPFRDVDWTVWGDLLDRVHAPKETVTIALVGKYIDLPDAYLSVTEALRAGGFAHRSRVQIRWVPSDDCQTPEGAEKALAGVDGVCVPGGLRRPRASRASSARCGTPAPTASRRWACASACSAWSSSTPATSPGLEKANSAEFDPETPDAVIATMASQVDVDRRRARHGRHHAAGQLPGQPAEGLGRGGRLRVAPTITERHRHRYEVANAYRDRLTEAGLVFSGTSPDGLLVEFAELPREAHPFYVGTQAHPELKSRPTRPHPLFAAFVQAAIDYQEAARLPVTFDEAEKVGI